MPTSPIELIKTLSDIDTPTLANAIEQLKVRSRIAGFTDSTLRCWFPELPSMCGVAVTAQVQTITTDGEGGLNKQFVDLCQAIEQHEEPCVVILHEVGSHPQLSATCGEVMATSFKHYGAVGIVSNAAVRDIHEVKGMAMPYFSTGAVASHGAFRVVDVQVPVTICGLRIHPGDLLHGDVNGLITIPQEGRDRLPEIAQSITENERELMKLILDNDDSIEKLRDRLTH